MNKCFLCFFTILFFSVSAKADVTAAFPGAKIINNKQIQIELTKTLVKGQDVSLSNQNKMIDNQIEVIKLLRQLNNNIKSLDKSLQSLDRSAKTNSVFLKRIYEK